MRRAVLLIFVGILLLAFGGALAQEGYELRNGTVGAGGGRLSGGSFILVASIRSGDRSALSGAGYSLVGDLAGGMKMDYRSYLPLTLAALTGE